MVGRLSRPEGIFMSENGVDADPVVEGSEDFETDMTDPENYGSLTIEDPDGDDDLEGSPEPAND